MLQRERTSHREPATLASETSRADLSTLGGILLIVLLTAAAYLPAMRGGYLMDDDLYVTANHLLPAGDGLYRFWFTTEPVDYFPLSNSLLWFEYHLWGINPIGYHVSNLIFHIAASMLVWMVLRQLTIPGAFFAALLFAIHPVNVESVAWIAQCKDVMAVFFLLLSILWYLKSDKGTWYWLSLAACVAAMLSKGSAVVLPPLLLLILWWKRGITRRDLLRTAPFFVAAALLTLVNMWFAFHSSATAIRHVTHVERLLGAAAVVWFYLYKALLPIDLSFVYPLWTIHAGELRWWLPLIAALVVTGLLIWKRRSRLGGTLLFAWMFFCIALVPVMGFTDVGFFQYSLVADHYQHIALLAVTTLLAAAWSRWPSPAARKISAVVIVLVLSGLTWQRNRLFGSPTALYEATLEKNPDCWLAHTNLGNEFVSAGQTEQAIEQFQSALRANPQYAVAHVSLGNLELNAGHTQEAIEQYRQAVALSPGLLVAEYNLGRALNGAGQPLEAIPHLEQALRAQPDYAEAHNNLGLAFASLGRTSEAVEEFQKAIQFKPDYAEAQSNWGNLLLQAGEFPLAIEHYQRALALKPDFFEAHNNLGAALGKLGRSGEAIQQYQIAVRLRPDYTQGYINMALTYAQMGQSADAIAAANQAIELAKSQGNSALANQIQAWLGRYQSAK
jgi:tetratricopeptide (TPR) repeat protein